MISEIARRMPPGGLGFGIPIGMGGGSGGGEAAGEDVSGAGGVGGEAGEAVAATDAAVEADRQATVASSGVASDPESPSALFGDAAPEDATATTDNASDMQEESTFGQESWNGGEQTFSDDAKFNDGFGEESFSTEDTFQEDGFREDTSFSTFEESASDVASDAAEGGSSIFSNLWDLFTGGGDD
jgi:hypothetical protein